MIVTGKHIPRRTVLRGLGAAISLPLLDGMVPAFAAIRTSAAKPVRRFGAVFVPMGASKSLTKGVNIDYWTPATDGPLALSPILTALESMKNRTLVLSGLGSHVADVKDGGPHPRLQTAWLTGTKCKPTEGADLQAGISLDQIVAAELGRETQIDSLQVGIEANDVIGTCAQRYSCAYGNTISWRNPTTPIPMENNPRAIFERLFGASDSTDAGARLAYIRKDRSVLDSVTTELARFQTGLSAGDRVKVDQYVDSVRDIERRIQTAEAQADKELPVVAQPVGIPSSYEEHVNLMFDLVTIAYQTDLTRVFSFLLGREASNRAYPEVGVPDAHHPLSHHQDNPEKMARLAKLNTFHLKLFARFVEKLQAIPDGDGTLLDHTIALYGSGMGDTNLHSALDLPTAVVSGSRIDIRTGRHVRYPIDEGRLTNLQLTLLEKLGLRVEHFGDSTGTLDLLSI
jgi:hypothetical protein